MSRSKAYIRKTKEEMQGGRPQDKEGVGVGIEIGVSGDRRVLWECRNQNPFSFSLLFQ